VSGFFVTFEGGEGAGKSTQSRRLAEQLYKQGRRVLHTREPGGSPGAERLRTLLLQGGHALSLRAEILVHFASRLDHIERTIVPALADGMLVICDRFFDSTLAYQGYGLGHGAPDALNFIRRLIELTPLKPDLTLLLDLPRDIARHRLSQRGSTPDRYEQLDEAFHLRVAEGFREIAQDAPERVVTIDGASEADQIHRTLLNEVEQRLPE
jgi:dTMP kinase